MSLLDRENDSSQSRNHAFVCFPGAPYTHASALRAARSTLTEHGWTIHERYTGGTTDEDTLRWVASQTQGNKKGQQNTTLYLMDYDLIPFDSIHPSRRTISSCESSASSYPIRKALIRKNWLYTSVHSHSVKTSARETPSALSYLPRTWSVEIQFADDLDELLIDELYDLKEILEEQEPQVQGEATVTNKKWFILKAGMADRGMGIKMFDSLDGLRGILEEWEDSETDDDLQEASSEDGQGRREGDKEEEEEEGNGVLLGQLRHFVIQEYISRPLLIAPNGSCPDSYRKFHLRAYVVCIGGLRVYLWDEMLALFAPRAYQDPSEDDDVKIHLTNTCLHGDGSGTADGRAAEENVHLFSDLCHDARGYLRPDGGTMVEKLTGEDLRRISRLAKDTIGITFEAAAKGSGSTNWLMWDGCWEIFGVDLMVGWSDGEEQWRMWLLEVNAQPDFAQSGAKLEKVIDDLFAATLRLAVLGQSDESCKGMTLCFEERMRGAW